MNQVRGFSIEKTEAPAGCQMETLPACIFRIPGIALVAAGSKACLSVLYRTALQAGALDRLYLCSMTRTDYSLGLSGERILEAVRAADRREDLRGILIYASCMERLTLWNLETGREKQGFRHPVSVLWRGPLMKRLTSPAAELQKILDAWGIDCGEQAGKAENTKVKNMGMQPERTADIPGKFHQDPGLPDFAQEISRLQGQDCDILLITPGGCRSALQLLPADALTNVWNTRFTDYFVSGSGLSDAADLIGGFFPADRPLYLISSAVPNLTGMDLQRTAKLLQMRGKEVHVVRCTGF